MLFEARYYCRGLLKTEYVNAVSATDVIDWLVRYSLENPEQHIEPCLPRLAKTSNDPVFRSLHSFNFFTDPSPWDLSPPSYNGMSITDILT